MKTPIKISKEAIRIPKPQPKKLRIVRNGKDGKTPTREELLEMIKPLIPDIPKEVVKTIPKKALTRLIEEYIANKPLTPPTVDFYMKETDAGTEVTINWVVHLIPRAVYWPKLRNLQQMWDVSVTNPSEWQWLVFKDWYWKNVPITNNETTTSVTTNINISETSWNYLYLVDTTLSDITIQLPTAIGNTANYQFKRISDWTYEAHIVPFGTETIDTYSILDILFKNTNIPIVSDGSNWLIL